MVAGTLAATGYSSGRNVWPGDEHNPKGYYEDKELLRLNADILSLNMPSPVETMAQNHPDAQKAPNEARWLSWLDLDKTLTLEPRFVPRIKSCLALEPFCFKDPQFCYTLDLWKPLLENTKFVSVFRSPSATIHSIVRYCSHFAHFKPLGIDEAYAQKLWLCMYKHILEKHSLSGEWFFVHYEQMFDQTVLERLEQFAQTKMEHHFPDRCLQNSTQQVEYSGEVAQVYRELCQRAGFDSSC